MTPEERFAEKYTMEPMSGCWLWTAGTNGTGYGKFRLGSLLDGTRREELAHRFSYELHRGPIPDGKHVCHRCDTPFCVNPDHLFLSDQAGNMADKVAKNRQSKGSSISWSKLDESDIPIIRQWLDDGWKQYEIADVWGVQQSLISQINTGKIWRHV